MSGSSSPMLLPRTCRIAALTSWCTCSLMAAGSVAAMAFLAPPAAFGAARRLWATAAWDANSAKKGGAAALR